MQKNLVLLVLVMLCSSTVFSQLMVSRLIGKNSGNSQLGYGVFSYFEFPLKYENQSLRLELLDFAFYPRKNSDIDATIGYLSIKGGYKYVFSETNAGWYVEPSAGYCRVVNSNDINPNSASYGDGFALALEAGYSLGVGQRDNTINFGLKYESDQAGSIFVANSIGFRVSFSFHILKRKDSY